MKKIISFIALFTMLLSCTNNESKDIDELNDAINFRTINDKLSSRAANASNDNYQVLAVETGGTSWFIDEAVNGTTNDMISGNSYYWFVPAVDINFWAYAPAQNSALTADNTYPNSTVTLTIPASANLDFTIAGEVTKSSGVVPLQFKHALSKLSFTATLAQDLTSAGYSITTQPTASLFVDVSTGSISPTDTSPAWTTTSSTSATYSDSTSYMIMPQSAIGDSIVLKGIEISKSDNVIFNGDLMGYVIKSGDIPAKSGSTSSANNFVMNTHYLFTFDITSSATDIEGDPVFGNVISFSTTLVDWDSLDVSVVQP